MNSGLIPGGQNSSRDRQTVFFTAVNPVHKNHQDTIELDLTKPRLASHEQKWKRHQELDLTKPRLASYEQKWKGIKTRCTGSIFSLLNVKD